MDDFDESSFDETDSKKEKKLDSVQEVVGFKREVDEYVPEMAELYKSQGGLD